ncbi:cytochrome P450 [Achaetomium macrosporum]|uniref:Cytochrome P450 n=1 Tax=Achaetomium macrosporum TaxID=79813 RepID=A0AAN7CER2_9PEZI|nr:cytochrome P450 [Achaetomium macrosporum]
MARLVEGLLVAGASNLHLLLSTAVVITYHLFTVTYNLFFHPLRHFPGPLLQRASALPWAIEHALGKTAFSTQKLHDRYGPVVRIAPGHLSFTDPGAWRDIYGPLPASSRSSNSNWPPELPKSRVFSAATDDQADSIHSAEFHEHALLRRALSQGFSDASLRQQEPVLRRYVDLLLRRMHERCEEASRGSGKEGVLLDMEKWYNWATFDIIGDLVFGQAFGCLEKGEYHPWIAFIIGTLKAAATFSSVVYLGGRWLVRLVFRTVGQKSILMLRSMTDDMVSKRLAMEKGRDDLFEGLVKYREEWNLSFEMLSANAFLLTLAGSETSATSLCGTTYLLLTNPEAMEKLTREVRTAFNSADEMTINAVSQLPYLTAVINESLRMYPPAASDLVRVTPPEGKQIAGRYVAGGSFVEIQPWSINHSSENWEEPWKFNPDRFLRGEEEARKAGNILEASQPFSWGQRNCLGRSLAFAEMRMILARIVYDFDMKPGPDCHDWIGRQRTFPLWNRLPLNVYFTPAEADYN